ncbi:DUF5597 domain-containing protein [Prevotella cerevisiae]|uniref:DUF5597 domain-containing protein n=1 Tax=Segatella cerevisiae TaxID=2053716 RepID=A0ABT1BTX8_9BACT|nr:DUF5597 domain-containing protein [Segatella cerevisiae]MCO6024548.1 DUF5597 domain-containing protein [Segatella cerevisiae]
MKKVLLLFIMLSSVLVLCADVRLQKHGSATQLIVNGKPMLILGGELSNSAVTSVADIDSVLPHMYALGLNTVFVPVYWDLMEPEEGEFDFSLVDESIKVAREHHLKLILLWFGVWKNSMSCCAPLWFKRNIKRFPRALTVTGKPMEIASAFSNHVMEADKRAFCQLLKHIARIDERESTVIMIQVENEIGMLESVRDHSSLAEKAFQQGKWRKITGDIGIASSIEQDERFQAFYYAQYIEQLVRSGKKILNIPMFVNAAMNSRGRKPGEYPSAGPLAHLIPIWKKAAPDIDVYAPDIYDVGFKNWVNLYKRNDNPFFTPETRLGPYSGVRALYAFGEVDALGYSVFALDQASEEATSPIKQSYALLHQLSPLLLREQGEKLSHGLLFNQKDQKRVINDKDVVITASHYYTLPWDSRATDGSVWPESGGLIIKLGQYDYLIAGNGIVVTFQTLSEKKQEEEVKLGEDGFLDAGRSVKGLSSLHLKTFYGKRLGIGFVDQVGLDQQGTIKFIRRDSGDQDHQGRHARISCDEFKILHVKLYKY